MHPSRPLVLLIVLLLASLGASSCALRHAAPPAINLTDPQNGNTFPSNASVTLHVTLYGVSGSSSLWDRYDYQVIEDGVIVSQASDQSITITQRSLLLRGLLDGTHLVVVRGRPSRPDPDYADLPNNTFRIYGDWYTSNPVCFFVGPNPPEDFCSNVTIAEPLRAVTATPSPLPTEAATPVPVIRSISALPSAVYYGSTCPSLSTVTFRADLSLPAGMPPDLIEARAHVSVVVGSGQSISGSFLVPLHPTGTSDTADGAAVYTGSLALTHAYNDAADQFDPASLAGGVGALLWYVDATSHDAAGQNAFSMGSTMEQVIDLSPCPVGAQPPALNNAAGSGSSNSCSQYSNELSCDLAACAWTGSACAISP